LELGGKGVGRRECAPGWSWGTWLAYFGEGQTGGAKKKTMLKDGGSASYGKKMWELGEFPIERKRTVFGEKSTDMYGGGGERGL